MLCVFVSSCKLSIVLNLKFLFWRTIHLSKQLYLQTLQTRRFSSPLPPHFDASELRDDHRTPKSGHVYLEKLLVTAEVGKILQTSNYWGKDFCIVIINTTGISQRPRSTKKWGGGGSLSFQRRQDIALDLKGSELGPEKKKTVPFAADVLPWRLFFGGRSPGVVFAWRVWVFSRGCSMAKWANESNQTAGL